MHSPLYMDVMLRPHRSMSPDGLKIVFLSLALVNLVVMSIFTVIGALPIPLFLGLDVLAIGVAFHFSQRAGNRAQQVQVSAEKVRVFEVSGTSRREIWASPTAFTRVSIDDLGEDEWWVRIHMSGKRLTVGRELSTPQRRQLGYDLQKAILDGRNERYRP